MPYCYCMHGIDELIEEFSDSNYSEGLCMSIREYKDQEECYKDMEFFDVGFDSLLFTMSGSCMIFTKERDDENAKQIVIDYCEHQIRNIQRFLATVDTWQITDK